MKKTALLIGASALIISCGENTKYEISGEASGVENGTMIYLEKINQETNQPYAIDSTMVENKAFYFKGEAPVMDQSFIAIKGTEGKVPFILESGKIEITVDTDQFEKSRAKGTVSNDEYAAFNLKRDGYMKEMADYRAQNQEGFAKAQENKDGAEMKRIMDGLSAIQEKVSEFYDSYLEEHPASMVTLITVNDFARRGYFSKEEIVEYYNKLGDKFQQVPMGQSLKVYMDQLPDPKIKIGDKAPDFSAKSPEGNEVSLQEALGKVTIIDFWASWCGPCRTENPNVVKLYEEFHDKGLNIIGVSLDKDADKWKEAIAEDKLTWFQVSNLQFWQDPIAKEYEVRAIPATFILDENGVVIAKNLRGKKLRDKISEILK